MLRQELDSQISPRTNTSLLFVAPSFALDLVIELNNSFQVHVEETEQGLDAYLRSLSILNLPHVILLEVDEAHACFTYINKLKKDVLFKGLIIILLTTKPDNVVKELAMKAKVNDLYVAPIPVKDLCERISFLVKFKLIKPQLSDLSNINFSYRIPITKRIFDVVASGFALLLLSPLLLVVAIIIALESKGPIVFKSKRVGTGYKIFNFYKFRSMRQGASSELQDLSVEFNQYNKSETGATTFVKLKNDPRITKFGKFIRKYSIDELPQLANVLIGDMSLVGNRPLPLYEAEMLTSNEWSMRFLGPAGLTGLWQVSRRGRADMSERERKKLDNFYAQNHSFWLDFKILLKTFPAAIQKESV